MKKNLFERGWRADQVKLKMKGHEAWTRKEAPRGLRRDRHPCTEWNFWEKFAFGFIFGLVWAHFIAGSVSLLLKEDCSRKRRHCFQATLAPCTPTHHQRKVLACDSLVCARVIRGAQCGFGFIYLSSLCISLRVPISLSLLSPKEKLLYLGPFVCLSVLLFVCVFERAELSCFSPQLLGRLRQKFHH